MPEISVVVPAYQAEKYLEICVESILAQTFKDFEVILVDDGSTDGTAELCHKLEVRDKRVRFIQHTRNKSQSAARNTGIMAARGKYVAFVDDDDLILENMLERCHDAAERWDADVVDTKCYIKSEADNGHIEKETALISCMELEPLAEESLLSPDLQTRLGMHLRYGLHGVIWNKMYRRDFLIRHNLLFPAEKIFSEDFLFATCCLFLAKRYLRIPDGFYVWCGNKASELRRPKSESHLAMMLSSMMDGAAYLARYLAKEPFFAEQPSRMAVVQQHWFAYCKQYRIYPHGFYQKGRFSGAVDAAVKNVLRERFGTQADFVAYLFHTMNAHYAEAVELLNENEKLKAKE